MRGEGFVKSSVRGEGFDRTIARSNARGKFMVALGHVGKRLVEPFLLMLWRRTNNVAAHDVLEQLVSRLVERLRFHRDPAWFLFLSVHVLAYESDA